MTRGLKIVLLLTTAAGLTAATHYKGYLETPVDITTIVPDAPQKGDVRYQADRKVFRATRAMLSTPRGRLAAADVPSSITDMMKDFSCAAGVKLSPESTPATYRLLANASADTGRSNNLAKEHWKRLRPFLIDKGPTCESQEELSKSYDYPSGHTTRGWTFGMVLTDAEPDRATPIQVRARSYGESRIICGAHNMSAVEAGRLGATVTMDTVRQSAGYQADLEAARAELKAARSDPTLAPDAGACSAETGLVAKSVLVGVKP